MGDLKASFTRFLLDPANHDLLTIVKAIRNGAVYGTKIRFPHALVMVLLFRSGSAREKVLSILTATRKHATNLALFAFIYKSIMLGLRHLAWSTPWPSSPALPKQPRPVEEPSVHSFLAGLAAGWAVFGRGRSGSDGVKQQIVIYVFARVTLGLAKLAVAPRAPRPSAHNAGYGPRYPPGYGLLDSAMSAVGIVNPAAQERVHKAIGKHSWAVFASVSWALVMWLFRWHPDVLQPSLRSSMKYLYDNAERWDGPKNWIWHNT